MPLHRRIAVWLLCTIAFAGTAQPSGKPDTSQESIFRVSVDLVQVDAVVTNSNEEPVTDLTAEDFIILQDGKPQQITNFSFIRTSDPATPAAASRKTTAKKERGRPMPPPPPMPLRREKLRRTIALLADDLGLSAEYAIRVRQWIRKWLEEEMEPNDLVAVLRTGGGVGALHQFTNDKRMLYAAADLINYNAASRVEITGGFDPIPKSSAIRYSSDGFALPMVTAERDLVFTKFTLGSIQYVVDALKDLPGRKSIILFSENFQLLFNGCQGQTQGRDVAMKEPLQRLVDAANRAAVVIHTIDPRGVVNTANICELLASQDGLSILAKETGGLFISGRNDVSRALTMVADDGNGYYLIGYQPDAQTISEIKKGKPKLHKIQVRVKRPGLTVRSRTEFFSSPDKKVPADLITRQERVGQALYSPFSGGELPLRLTALFSQTKDEKSVIHSLLHFDANQLVFTDEPDDWHKATIEVTAALFDSEGQQVDFTDRKWNLIVKGQTYEFMQKSGASFLMYVPVKQPGAYQMRLVVRDTATGKLGSATRVVEVPDLRDGRLALSGILLAADKAKSEAAVEQAEGLIEEAEAKRTAAVRIFEAGETIAWAYQILNAKNDRDRKPQLQSQLRLYHEGRLVYEGTPSAMNSPQGGSKRMIAVDQLHLKQLPPGFYVLQIAVSDMLADEKRRTAVQSIDFDAQSSDGESNQTP